MRYFLRFVCLLQLHVCCSFGQISMANEGHIVGVQVENGDTIYLSHLRELEVWAQRKFKSKADERAFWRLVNNVKRTYPYAKLAGIKLGELNEHYLQLNKESDRKKYSKEVEKELMSEFEGELKKLTLSQGRILLRLVDRETGNTTYEIVKNFRGSFSAVFWQTVAKLFGSNLKSQFDATTGEDQTIEQIIRQIEAGYL